MVVTGRVQKRAVGAGTKSARDAVVLHTDIGDYVLRREGGNAFKDGVLDRLIGKEIRARGRVVDYTLIMSDWVELGGLQDPGDRSAGR